MSLSRFALLLRANRTLLCRFSSSNQGNDEEIKLKKFERTPVGRLEDDKSLNATDQPERRARIFKPARNVGQAGWGTTNRWKIELDQQERWENPLIGYSSSGDPLSNISMQLNFPTEQDAIAFCEKNSWSYTVEKPQERQIKPKNYNSNFVWKGKMSAALIPDAQKGATEEQTSVQKMLIENGRLIEAIAEYQRLGRPAEAMKYQDLLHRNLLYLSRFVDPRMTQQLQNIRAPPAVEQPTETPGNSTAPSQQPPQIQPQMPQTANGALPSPQGNQQLPAPNGPMMSTSPHNPTGYPMNGTPMSQPPPMPTHLMPMQ
ncbi:NADH dehydrogenase [ubiquinone] iron-sulfur protein 4, mitochondrial [Aphelenchoides bicaudatus]|nr:NADH dehydrogenase [ubiquinone] iron-sulfur protein 4, mitochondrial [Aphelenchoides bicaudatus]